MTNPLLAEWDTPFGLPPFDLIETTHFAPAFETALQDARAEIAAITGNPDAPDFANTVEALELAGEGLNKVLAPFYQLSGTDSTPEREALMREFSPKLAAYSSDVMLDAALFARIEAVWQAREALDLTPEQLRLLELTRRNFVRSGAALDDAGRARLREINGKLAELGTAFSQNLLADERGWSMALGADDLAGLPDFVVETAASAAQERGEDGHVVTLSRSLIVPFLQASSKLRLLCRLG